MENENKNYAFPLHRNMNNKKRSFQECTSTLLPTCCHSNISTVNSHNINNNHYNDEDTIMAMNDSTTYSATIPISTNHYDMSMSNSICFTSIQNPLKRLKLIDDDGGDHDEHDVHDVTNDDGGGKRSVSIDEDIILNHYHQNQEQECQIRHQHQLQQQQQQLSFFHNQ